jgi:antitoxin component YwqK of YwqJK toxin-antitoxin module
MSLRALLAALAIVVGSGAAATEVGSRECPPGSSLRQDGLEFACETPNGVGDGPFWRLYEDGTLRLWGTLRAGTLHGAWVAFHENGARATEAEYRDGVLSGWFRRWTRSGQLEYEGRHDDAGEMHGTWSRWWPNGKLRAHWEMQHGRASGEVETFHESGERASAGERSGGLREGAWTWWSADGSVAAECRYERGEVVAGRCGN